MKFVFQPSTMHVLAISLLLAACNPHANSENTTKEEVEPELGAFTIDYESEDLQSTFNTKGKGLPQVVSYKKEICKAKDSVEINYSALDSLFENGTDVNEVFKEKNTGTIGFGFDFTVKEGFFLTDGRTSTSILQTNAMEIAVSKYDRRMTDKNFDLIHFLLSRGFDANEGGVGPLFAFVKNNASQFRLRKEKIHELIGLFTFYGFDMKNLDLSACDSEQNVLDYLIDMGATNYNMKYFRFPSDLQDLYDQRESLSERGVVFGFQEVNAETFPFEADTVSLKLMLEMGLSPDHITPERKKLGDDFGRFTKKSMNRVLDRWRNDHPHQE